MVVSDPRALIHGSRVLAVAAPSWSLSRVPGREVLSGTSVAVKRRMLFRHCQQFGPTGGLCAAIGPATVM